MLSARKTLETDNRGSVLKEMDWPIVTGENKVGDKNS
jgi:hypothetical protein